MVYRVAPSGDSAGADATGPQDVSVGWFGAYFTVGLGANPSARDGLGPAGRQLGSLFRVGRFTGVRRVADLAAYEAANDPDKGQPSAEVDSNPYSVDASNPLSILVTDAGGNDLLRVRPWDGWRPRPCSRSARPPRRPSSASRPDQDPLPARSDERCPRTALTSGSSPASRSRLGRRTSSGFAAAAGRPSPRAGFTTVVDVANGPRGSLYVLQIASDSLAGPPTPGRLLRVNRDGSRTELAAGQLQEPTGLAVDGRNVYVANNGGSPTDGQIVRIRDTG